MKESYPETAPQLVETQIPDKVIYRGLNDKLADQLIRKSHQMHIKKWEPGDAEVRFKNREMLDAWLRQGREVYPLVKENNRGYQQMAGIIWYGERRMPVNSDISNLPNHTFAIRMYKPFVIRGQDQLFMQDAHKDYLQLLAAQSKAEQFQGLWLRSSIHDQESRLRYQQFGYRDVLFSGDEVIMVLPDQRMVEILGA